MDLEKRNSKRSFLQLFDWNIKSRKKLFSNKSESSAAEKLNQGNENLNDSKFSKLQQVARNGHGPGPNMIENYNLNCTSYPNGGDMMYGTKAPGVVARLMGLDSLPTLDTVEPSLTPESFRDTHYSAGFPGFQSEHMIMYDGMRNKLDGFSKNPVEVMLHKVQSRPIEKFQTEVLPPKSAKPISITHHRLLSPIKSPGFIRTMDADCLMEAASKIIEQSPRSMMRHKLPSLGSSVPLRIQDIKEKVEAAEKSRRIFRTSQKGKEQSFTQYGRAHGRAEGLDLLRASGKPTATNSEDSRRTKPASFPFQAKPKIPKRDELGSVDCPVYVNQRQPSEIRRGFIGRNVEKKHKNVEMKSRISKQSDVLRQNNQKQSSEPKKERDTLRRSLSNEKERKPSSSTGFSHPNKTVNRIVVSNYSLSTKTEPLASDSRKEQASSMSKKSARKEVTNVNRVSDEGNVAILSRDERSINCNYESQKSNLWDSAVGKNGMDVVSFTFNSPIKKPSSGSTLSGKSPESKRASFVIPDSCNYQSNQELDVASGDSLSILLEQKLKELASRVEASQQDIIYSELLCGSADSSRASVPTVDMCHTTSSKSTNCNSQLGPSGDKAGVSFQFDCSSSSSLGESWHNQMPKWQGPNEACIGTLPSYSEGNCKSWDNGGYINNKGSKRCLSVEALEISGWSSSRNSQRGVDTELFDSASTTSLGTSTSDITSTITSSIIRESSNWELDYIKFITTNATSMFEEFALGQAQKLVAPGLFDLMEEDWWNQNLGENLRLSRRALFDCVGESLESRCLPLINKGGKHWTKLTVVFGQRIDRLSEELYREISGWTRMEELMVDELVDKDMSTQLGRWVDFETEEFEEGVQIEEDILTCLFDELISEFFLV